jgi:hypothetical protein
MRFLRQKNVLPQGGDLLELGEANWYGDVDPNTLRADIREFAPLAKQESLLAELDEAIQSKKPNRHWDIAKIYWNTFLQPSSMTPIDFHGSEKALKLDLNSTIDLERQFHIVSNGGTLEHIFNVAQALKTVHDHAVPGGFMIHITPFTGWIDHGFYNFNPTFFFDLSSINNYRIRLFVYFELRPPKIIQLKDREQIPRMAKNGDIGKESSLFIALCKPTEPAQPFRMPIQGYYAGNISKEAAEAWRTLR